MKITCEFEIPTEVFEKAVDNSIKNNPDLTLVTRCKDCKYWKDTSFDIVTEAHWGECQKPLGDYRCCETAENDYCSYAEKKGGAE